MLATTCGFIAIKGKKMADTRTYKIKRFHRDDSDLNFTVKTGLTLAEAQEHCRDPETSSSTATQPEAIEYTRKHGPWFDGYTEE